MSTIAPGRLLSVEGVGDPVSVLQTNLEALTEDVYEFTPTYQSGVETALIGPPTSGTFTVDTLWKDAWLATWRCTVAGTPGTWRQETAAIRAGEPSSGTIPTNYQILDSSANYRRKYHAGAYSWTQVYQPYSATSTVFNDVFDTLGAMGAAGGIYWRSGDDITATAALTGILRGNGASGPEVIGSLTANRMARIGTSGQTLVNSIVRDDGTNVCVGADVVAGQLVFQVTGGVSLIGASTLKTSTGALTLDTTDSSVINFKIGGSNGWLITSASVLEAVGAATVRTSTGILTIATGAANGSVVIKPHGTGDVDIYRTTGGTLSWSVLGASGILQSNGAQTIQTSTGQLDIKTAAGNGDIVLTPHGTGDVKIASAATANAILYNDGSSDVSSDVNLTWNALQLMINSGTAYGRLGQGFEVNASANFGGAALTSWTATADQAALLDFNRSKSASIGTHTIVANSDRLGTFVFRGSDGSAFVDAVEVSAYVDGTPGAGSVPGSLRFIISGTEAWRITNGRVWQSNGAQTIQTSTGNLTYNTAAGNGSHIFTANGTGDFQVFTNMLYVDQSAGNVGIGTTSPGAELTIANGKGLLIGADSQIITDGGTLELQFLGTGNVDSRGLFARFSADALGPELQLLKSRNATIGSSTIVQDNDKLGILSFLVDDGTDFTTSGAQFWAEVDDASPAGDDIGTAFVWSQMGGGGVALRETMRIAASGNVGIGTTSPGQLLEVKKATDKLIRLNRASGGASDIFDVGVESSGANYGLGIWNGSGTHLVNILETGKVGIGTTSPSTLLHVGLAGTTLGTIGIAGNTSGLVTLTVAAAAGTWTMKLPTGVGTAGYQLTDAAGDGITSWAAAASTRDAKHVLGIFDDADSALKKMLSSQVYRFKYREGCGTGDCVTEYAGVMADEAPWAMHHDRGILNPVNCFGYTVLSIQALHRKIESLESELEQLKNKSA